MLFYVTFLLAVLVAIGARPEVKCPVPLSPVNGQIFVAKAGSSVKYTCNPGFELKGTQIAICKGEEWYPEAPTCEPDSSEQLTTDEKTTATSTQRPLFKWDDDKDNETMQGDPPQVVYYRRHAAWPYHYRAALHDENGQVNEEALRNYHYWASHYPRSAVAEYGAGQPLSESQWAWINSHHPDIRDQYLKDIYGLRANEVSYLSYPYNYYNPYYVRQPLAAVYEDPVAVFDYSCHRTERDGTVVTIKAPKLANAYVYRYDRRQNRNYPHNDYLAAEYRCKAGYRLLDSGSHELYCSHSNWVGNTPVCVPKI